MDDILDLFDKSAEFKKADEVSDYARKVVEKLKPFKEEFSHEFDFGVMAWKFYNSKLNLVLESQQGDFPILNCNHETRIKIGIDGINAFLHEYAKHLGLKK